MKRIIYLTVVVACLLSCSERKSFTISGTLPSNKYDGEWIYLVPMIGANHKTVDSVRIEKGKFAFHGNKEKMCVIRVKPILRLELQDLLVVTEEGNISIYMGSPSHGGGTPQNDALQQWKSQIERTRMMSMKAYQATEKCSKSDSTIWKARIDSTEKALRTFEVSLLKRQRDNTLGRFVYEQAGFSLSPKDKKEIDPLFPPKK